MTPSGTSDKRKGMTRVYPLFSLVLAIVSFSILSADINILSSIFLFLKFTYNNFVFELRLSIDGNSPYFDPLLLRNSRLEKSSIKNLFFKFSHTVCQWEKKCTYTILSKLTNCNCTRKFFSYRFSNPLLISRVRRLSFLFFER